MRCCLIYIFLYNIFLLLLFCFFFLMLMKRQTLFFSDSDASDDDFNSRRSTHGPNGGLDDPLSTDTRAPFMASQAPLSSRPANTAEDPLQQSTKMTATRRNLSQLFDGGASSLARPTASDTTGAPRVSHDAVIQSTLNPSLLSSSASMATAATGLPAAPRFTYEGRSSTSTSMDGGSNRAPGGAGSHTAIESDSPAASAAAGLTTALHAVVQAYRDTLPCGTCVLALYVPPKVSSTAAAVAASPLQNNANKLPSSSASSLSSLLQQQLQLPPSAAARERLQRDGSHAVQQQLTVSSSSSPLLLLMNVNRQVLCSFPLDRPDVVFDNGGLQLQQDRQQPSFLAFFGASTPLTPEATSSACCRWTCMFQDREKASEFLVATYTVAQYAATLAKKAGTFSGVVPTVRVMPHSSSSSPVTTNVNAAHDGVDGGDDAVESGLDDVEDSDMEGPGSHESSRVRLGVPTKIYWTTWMLRRFSRATPYCLPTDVVDGTSPLLPCVVAPGAGVLRDGLEAALVGMRSGESRLVFMSAEETQVRHPEQTSSLTPLLMSKSPSARGSRRRRHHADVQDARAELRTLDKPAVAYVTCVEPVVSTPTTDAPPAQPAPSQQMASADLANSAASVDTGVLLQQLLVNTLQQQQQQQQPQGSASAFGALERSLDRVMLQLGSLYEKVDRLDIEGKLARNNAALEQAMKRVVGLAPQDDVAVEDTLKDRDALLASIERYRHQYEEANTNYQQALEAVGRATERAHALEKDLQVQHDLWARQRNDAAEQTRLKLLEKDVRHREELERVAETRYAAGKSDGHAAGYREGRQAALTAIDGEGGVNAVTAEWRAKLTARDQQIVVLQTSLQDAKFHHERDRRQLMAEIDVLTTLNEKLQHLQANADVRMPEETTQQQCKRVKRTLNSVYAQLEAQLLTLPLHRLANGDHINAAGENESIRVVSVDDALAMVMTVIRAEAQSAVAQIKADGERHAKANADVRALTLARQHTQRPAVAYGGEEAAAVGDNYKKLRDDADSNGVRGRDAAGSASVEAAARDPTARSSENTSVMSPEAGGERGTDEVDRSPSAFSSSSSPFSAASATPSRQATRLSDPPPPPSMRAETTHDIHSDMSPPELTGRGGAEYPTGVAHASSSQDTTDDLPVGEPDVSAA